MAFPQTALDFRAELDLGGTWTDITDYVYQRNGAVSVSRGKPDEAKTLNPGLANLELNNRDGRFSPRNPIGTYYGNLVRNTPNRLSVPAQTSYLRLEGDTTSFVSTPDSAGLSITGDTEIQVDVLITGWAEMTLASKLTESGNQRSWILAVLGDGTVAFDWSSGGTTLISAHSTVPLPMGRIALKVTLAVATGTVTFYTAPSISGSWTQLGDASVLGAASVFDSTAPVLIGYDANFSNLLPSMQGNVYGFKLISGIGGTTKAFADFTAQTAGATSFTDAQSNTWTLNGTAEISNRNYRFHGEVAAFPQRWDSSGNDVWSPVQASGVTRRLTQGSPASDSVMKRYNRTLSGSSALLAYWPCEDGSTSNQIGATIGNVMSVTGSPGMASNTSFTCSQAIPALKGSIWQADIDRASTTPTVNNLKFLLSIPSAGEDPALGDDGPIAWMYTTGTIAKLELFYTGPGLDAGGALELFGYKNDGSVAFSGVIEGPVDGMNTLVSMALVKNGTGVDCDYQWLDQVNPSVVNATGGTVASASVGQITRIVINPIGAFSTTAVGHIMVSTSNDISNYSDPFNAYQGETAAARLIRICTEEGLDYRIYGYPDNTQAMGAQTAKAIMPLLQEVEDTDRGMLFEPRQVLGIGYRTRESIENQSPVVTLSYTNSDLGTDSSTSIEPTDDDQYTRNDVTITRASGSSGRQTLTSGTLSTLPPDEGGVGTYDYSQTYSLFEDGQAINLAGWILHVGTTDEPRYPSIPVNLARSELAGNATKYYGLQVMDQGDYLAVTSLPVWLPPGNLKQLVAGTRENMGGFVFNITFNGIPELPYEIGVVGTGATSDNRVDTDGSTLHAGINSSATSLSVDTTVLTTQSVNLWTTTAGDFPFDIMMGGEQMTVTNVTGSSSPQTFTVTRSINGVVKAHTAGESINVYDYAIVALDDPF